MEYLKRAQPHPAGEDRRLRDTVSEILLAVERDGISAVRRYSERFDAWNPDTFRVSDNAITSARQHVGDGMAEHIAFARDQVRHFAELQRGSFREIEVETLPGVAGAACRGPAPGTMQVRKHQYTRPGTGDTT